ncbi:MAG TPA: DUF2283 domain-containing protein [Bacillota bacterium]|nr:DUF2283 domain-containing protein [Bacillota bacterium]
MKIRIDTETDTLYFQIMDKDIVESEEIRRGFILDYDKDGNVVGVEILGISDKASAEDLKKMEFLTA